MEVSSKSPVNDVISREFTELLEETDFDNGDISPEFPIKEEMVEEVMRELYKEIAWTETAALPSSPPPWPAPALVPACYVESGKGESCGAAVSDRWSSVMAGVEFVGGNVVDAGAVAEKGCRCGSGGVGGERREKMNGCDEVEYDDEWLEMVLGWVPLEGLGDWT